jgi:hypothetical protein
MASPGRTARERGIDGTTARAVDPHGTEKTKGAPQGALVLESIRPGRIYSGM